MKRLAALAALFALALPAWAKTVWLVGEGAPINAPAFAEWLSDMLGEPVETVECGPYLSAWANTPPDEARRAQLAADTLLVSLPAEEPENLAVMGLRALREARPMGALPPLVVAAQTPVYKMSGLCDDNALARAWRLAESAGCPLAATPKAWERVYTDDTFYNGLVPKGTRAEAYVQAAAVTLALRGREAPLPDFPGLHPEVAEDLIDSIRDGFDRTEDIRHLAARLHLPALPLRAETAFTAVLYDGTFERALGDWLLRLAKADGRELTLRYTTERDLNTGLPCLFRTAQPPTGDVPNALLYTRPPFADAREELAHLDAILRNDGAKDNWLPFPLAVAEFTRRLPTQPVYDGAKPTGPAAAMFAAMIYLKWTGSAVLPTGCTQTETVAIAIGLDTILRPATLTAAPNAVFFRPLGDNRYAFTLWRAPTDDVTLELSLWAQPGKDAGHIEPAALEFSPETYWQSQTVTVSDAEGQTLLWKLHPAQPGQTTGARALP